MSSDVSWEEDALSQALREAAREHAVVLARERSAYRDAIKRAHQAEAALKALPEAMARAAEAHAALDMLSDKRMGELVGSDAKALLRDLIGSFKHPKGMVDSSSAAKASAEAASAGWDAAATAARADMDAMADLLGMEVALLEVAAANATCQLLSERERTAHLIRDVKSAQVLGISVSEQLDQATLRVGDLEQMTAGLRAEMCAQREAREKLEAELAEERKRRVSLRLRLYFERAIAREQRLQAARRAEAARNERVRKALQQHVASELRSLSKISTLLAPAAFVASHRHPK